MPFTNKRQKVTEEAFNDPKPGMCFEEFCTFWLFVTYRCGNVVVTCESSGDEGILPDDGVWHVYTVEQFKDRFAYHSIPGYWASLADTQYDVTGWFESGPFVNYFDTPEDEIEFGWLPS